MTYAEKTRVEQSGRIYIVVNATLIPSETVRFLIDATTRVSPAPHSFRKEFFEGPFCHHLIEILLHKRTQDVLIAFVRR